MAASSTWSSSAWPSARSRLAQLAKGRDPEAGYDPLLAARMRAVLPACRRNGIRIVTNMGAANPLAAARKVAEVARELGLAGLKVAAVLGDDVLDALRGGDYALDETGGTVAALGNRLVSANAYLGAGPIVEALEGGADVVITGRAADPAMFLAPLVHEFGWSMQDWTRLGRGTVVGHLLECAGQVTGGYFADPGYKDVPDLARLGFPLAEVGGGRHGGDHQGAGLGRRRSTAATCKEQLLYEVHDPARYLQPDVVADFSGVAVEEDGPDRVRVAGGDGAPRTGMLKVSVGCHRGLVRRGPDLLRRAGRLGARAARAGDRQGAPGADRPASGGTALRPHRGGRHPRPEALRRRPRPSRARCAPAWSAAPRAWARRSGSATRWTRSTSTARPAAAA